MLEEEMEENIGETTGIVKPISSDNMEENTDQHSHDERIFTNIGEDLHHENTNDVGEKIEPLIPKETANQYSRLNNMSDGQSNLSYDNERNHESYIQQSDDSHDSDNTVHAHVVDNKSTNIVSRENVSSQSNAKRFSSSTYPSGSSSSQYDSDYKRMHNEVEMQRKPRARRMKLSITKVDAWSVAKVTFLLTVAGGIIQIVAVGVLWGILNIVGVFDKFSQIFSSTGLTGSSVNIADILSLPSILSFFTLFSIAEVIIITVVATVLALIYNIVSVLVGGIHVTLGDD